MRRSTKWIVIVVGLAALAGLFVVLRPGGSSTDRSAPNTGPGPTLLAVMVLFTIGGLLILSGG